MHLFCDINKLFGDHIFDNYFSSLAACAQKLQDCGVKVMDDVNVLRLNKETLVSFCE